ncbi:uncharacterized protein [Dysidea avara]|uniref:uncharacterized protein isoform X2 n=1 Tax=Dysidea avara TaxID=196820 RepID=UPI00331E2B79
MAADWSVECSSDSDGEQFFQALGEHFKSQVKGHYFQTSRERADIKLDCIKNVKRKKRSKKQYAVGRLPKPDQDIGASDSTPSDMRSPLSSGGREPPQNQQQRRNLSAFEYDDFPALTGKPHSNTSRKSPVVKRKKGGKPVVAQLDRAVSSYTRHKFLDQQQVKLSEQETLQQRLQPPPLPAVVIGRTTESPVKPTDLSFDSDSDKDSTSSPNLIENSLQSQIRKVGQLLENDGLT